LATVQSSSSSCPEPWLAGHRDALFRYARIRVQSGHAAEDLVQETLLAAWRGRDTFAGKSSERTWLIGILKHKLAGHRRRADRELRATPAGADGVDPLDDSFDADGNWRRAPARWPEPEQAPEQYQFCQTLIDCIAALPPLQARAFSLRELDGLSGDEICRTLQVTPAHLWVLLYRARMRLRQGLEDHWFHSQHVE
jgi:RNA polymerase sigma-70 factor (ECF subfamily)